MLAVLRGERLADFVAALERTTTANAQMLTYYQGRMESLASAIARTAP
ncbi:MAG: hypothetical protein ACRDT6_01585 [Micromonosporaceae bacterium]